MTPATALLVRARAIGAELWVEGELLRWRCPGGLPEDLKADLAANKPGILAILTSEPDVQKNSLPETSHRNDRHHRCNRHTGVHRLWSVVEADGTARVSSFAPAQTMGEVLSRYEGASVAPVEDPDEGEPLPPDIEAAVLAWLDRIGEDDPQTRAEALQLAKARPSVRQAYQRMARSGEPQKPNHEGLDNPQEPRP